MAHIEPDKDRQQQRRIRLTAAVLVLLVIGLYALTFLRHQA